MCHKTGMDKIKDKALDVKVKANKMVYKAEEIMGDMGEKAEENLDKAKDKIEETAYKVTDKIEETAYKVTDKIDDAWKSVKKG